MSDSFALALAEVLKHEGGYICDPEDPGGETKYGISKRAYPGEDIRNLTIERATYLYRRDYWDRIHGDELPEPVAMVVFDAAVNMGCGPAIRMLQDVVSVTVDGVMGAVTVHAVKQCIPTSVVRLYTERRLERYERMVHFERFGRGWLARALAVEQAAVELA